jgi:hypothetical protein
MLVIWDVPLLNWSGRNSNKFVILFYENGRSSKTIDGIDGRFDSFRG